MGPYWSEFLSTRPTVMLTLPLCPFSDSLPGTVEQLSLHPGCIQKREILPFLERFFFCYFLTRIQTEKQVHSTVTSFVFFSNNNSSGTLNGAFKPGKAIKLSVVTKCWKTPVPISPVLFYC